MRFFEVGVYRDDVLNVCDDLDGAIAPLQTLCNSPRKSEQNDEALKMALEARRFITGVVSAPEVTHEETKDFEEERSSPAFKM